MAEFILPQNLGNVWASSGDVLKPTDSKIVQGWSAEIPPRQWFNWLDNRQDQAIAHIAQHGISVWNSTLEYQANKSYVQGSDGLVYKATTTNINVNPVGDSTGAWASAFITAATATQVASAAQTRAMTADNVYLSPLQLANAFTGANQSLSSGSAMQKLPGNLIIQSGSYNTTNGSATVTFPKSFPNAVVSVVVTDNGAATWTSTNVTTNGVSNATVNGFVGRSFTSNGNGAWVAGVANCCYVAIGY